MKSTEEPRSNSWTYSDKFYHKDYVAKNREAINAKKRAWRKDRKLGLKEPVSQTTQRDTR